MALPDLYKKNVSKAVHSSLRTTIRCDTHNQLTACAVCCSCEHGRSLPGVSHQLTACAVRCPLPGKYLPVQARQMLAGCIAQNMVTIQ